MFARSFLALGACALLSSLAMADDGCPVVTTATCYEFATPFSPAAYAKGLNCGADAQSTGYWECTPTPVAYTQVNTVFVTCTKQTLTQKVNESYLPGSGGFAMGEANVRESVALEVTNNLSGVLPFLCSN